MKSFEFHRISVAAERRAAFEAQTPKIWWEQHISPTLVITDTAVAAEVLRSRLFITPDLRSLVRELRVNHPLSLDHLQQTLELLPPFLEGEMHMRIRKLLGQYLSAKRPELEMEVPRIIGELLGRVSQPCAVDFATDVLQPLTRRVFSHLAGRDLTDQIMDARLARIFETTHSASSLGKIEAILDRVFAFLDCDDPEDDEFICQLCCIVFGLDNVSSTLAENIASAFQASDGAAPALLPDFPTELMLSATYRRSTETTEVAGQLVHPHNLIRIHIEPFGYSSDSAVRAGMFGVGRHACIGKQLSLDIWKHLAAQFNARAFRGRIIDYRSDCTHSFNYVTTLRVSIEP